VGRILLIIIAALAVLAAVPLLLLSLRGSLAVRRFRRVHGSRGKDLLIVYSASPHWQRYIEEHWLPRWGDRAVVLDWSGRSRWTAVGASEAPPEVQLFRAVSGSREFNPLAVVVPLTGPISVVRFWRAFRDAKHGNEAALRAAEQRLEHTLGPPPQPGAL
jgi:hypothetical protein